MSHFSLPIGRTFCHAEIRPIGCEEGCEEGAPVTEVLYLYISPVDAH
jgi:hypothetical protein